ncbi:hypothetical protein Poli38472_014627 [Pythium oligandrum]|uniref:Arrestin C-terminal-like domain-containing protein n=1 Tax=Pythium oligandrum TaxID=41045 RepID=A0A8K1CIB4_PYTOL|nr:hypothetical protein Poli38472_014627 [Pythium oligandrum]|eukprot:TMW63922.1 hypothetical protein Poli38472_014627 [Pythium oligandrum]
MGRCAATLGIGLKGSVTIELERPVYWPGDTVAGHVTLRVHQPIETKAFELAVIGEEALTWTTRHKNGSSGTRTMYHERQRYLLDIRLVLAPPGRFTPGDYVFPFALVLPAGLPSSLAYRNSYVSGMRDVDGSVSYRVKTWLPVHGMFKADLLTERSIAILSRPPVQPQLVQANFTRKVDFLGLFNKGQCAVTSTLISDVLTVGQVAEIQCHIHNSSKKRLQYIRACILQDVDLLPGDSWSGGGDVRRINIKEYPGLDPGQASLTVCQVSITPNGRFTGAAYLEPSFQGKFLSIKYYLQVKCKYALSPSATIKIPITIVPAGA